MKAALRTFAMLWLPAMAVLLSGLPALLRTGQVDPRAWAAPSIILIVAALFLKLRRSGVHAIWMSGGALIATLLFAGLATGRAPDPADAAWLTGVAFLAAAGGMLLPVRWPVGAAACGLALAVCWLSADRLVAPAAGPRPALGVVSGLPLFWQEQRSGMASRADAPIVRLLRQGFDVTPLDRLEAPALSRIDALLLAQPRAMSPAEMAAIDAWARGGGRALILADPLLRWPSPLPLGDRRRPPVVSLLTPLFEHWGLRLSSPSFPAEESLHFLPDGRLLRGFAASSFQAEEPGCRMEAAGLLARCAIGRGAVLLAADADLVDDRLWLADPSAPLDPRQWTADTPQWVAEALGGALSTRARHWLRSEASLISGLRWAILFGIFWAALGSWLIRPPERIERPFARTCPPPKRE